MKRMMILPTYYCNFNCKHCGVKKSGNKTYISSELLKKALNFTKKMGFKGIVFTGGGEPTIKFPKLLEFIKISKGMGFDVALVSNGSFASNNENSVRSLKKSGLNHLALSFDIYHSEFIKKSTIVEILKSSLKEKLKVRLKIHTSLNDYESNRALLTDIVNLLEGKLVKIFSYKFVEEFEYFLIFTKNGVIPATLINIEKSQFNSEIPSEGFKKINPNELAFYRCDMGTRNIDLHGDVYLCESFPASGTDIYKLFNLKEKGAMENNRLIEMEDFIHGDNWVFLKSYIKMSRNPKLKKYLKEEFNSRCDFCKLIIENYDELEKTPDPTKFTMIKFFLRSLPTSAFILIHRLRVFLFQKGCDFMNVLFYGKGY